MPHNLTRGNGPAMIPKGIIATRRFGMNSVRWSVLSILLIAVFPISACTQTKTSAEQTKASPAIHVKRQSRDDGAIISRYEGSPSGRVLFAKGGTERALVRQWMTSFDEMKDTGDALVSQMSSMVSANSSKGLLGLMRHAEDGRVRLTVYSGEPPGGNEAINYEARDSRSGISVRTDRVVSMADTKAWLEAANKAADESDFSDWATLLTANHAKGLTGVSCAFNEISVETFWQWR
jgi:hypothetical protein